MAQLYSCVFEDCHKYSFNSILKCSLVVCGMNLEGPRGIRLCVKCSKFHVQIEGK